MCHTMVEAKAKSVVKRPLAIITRSPPYSRPDKGAPAPSDAQHSNTHAQPITTHRAHRETRGKGSVRDGRQ